MGLPPDEHLPEVVPDTSPQAISYVEEQYKQRQYDDRDKYPVLYDDAPKIPSGMAYAQGQQYPAMAETSPGGSLPWEPLSAIEETQAGHAGGATGGGGGGHAGVGGVGAVDGGEPERPVDERRICGLRRKIFFIVLIVALVVLAVAIGGGVGGGVSAARSRKNSDSGSSSSVAPTSTTEPSSISSSATSTGTSSSARASPTFLNNETTTDDFAFQGFSEFGYQGKATKVINQEGFHNLGLDCNSYVWLPNKTNCCVTFCADEFNATGYRCESRKREKASGPFPRIYIWCNEDIKTTTANVTCS